MTPPLETLARIGAPATARWSTPATHLAVNSPVPRPEPAALHGTGPEALAVIEDALAQHGLRLG